MGAPSPDAVLFASYGTTHADQREASLMPVAAALHEAFPDAIVAQGYTSAKVLRALRARGEAADDVDAALESLAAAGAREVLVQPGHVVAGEAFAQVRGAVERARAAGAFRRVELGAPLLSSAVDVQDVAAALGTAHPRRRGSTVLVVGHGADEIAGLPYAALGYCFWEQGRDDVATAAMHGYPGLDAAARLLARRVGRDTDFAAARRVEIVPLMLTAGSHARRDLAGADARSWASLLRAKGYVVEGRLEGLGAVRGVVSVYVDHARRAWGTR